jgi:putative addiction module killer protein
MAFKVVELLREDGTSPYGAWFTALESQAAAKILTATMRMEQGNLSSVKWFSGVGEYKVDWGPGYRIYIAKDGQEIVVLLGGGTKKGQQKDIERALAMWQDYKRRKAKAARQR